MSRLITAILSIAVLASLGTGGCDSGERSVTLRFRYEPGTQTTYQQIGVREYKLTEKDSVVQQGTSTTTWTITQTVRRVLEDSTADVLELLKWDVIGPNKEDPTKIDTLHASRETAVYVTPRGRIVDLEFISEMDSTEARYLRDYYEQGFPMFPELPLKKGQSWTQTADVDLADTTAQASTTYTLRDFATEDGYDVALIDYDGNLIIPIEPSPTDSLHRSGIDRIRISGTLRFAYAQGMVLSINETWEVDGDRRRLKDGAMSAFKIAVNMDITYRLVETAKVGT